MADDDKLQADPLEMINLKVKAQDRSELFFRVKKNTQLKKVMSAYIEHPSVEYKIFEFLFDGRRIRGDQTPLQLGMEDGDEIDAMRHMYGSGPATAT